MYPRAKALGGRSYHRLDLSCLRPRHALKEVLVPEGETPRTDKLVVDVAVFGHENAQGTVLTI